MDPAYELFLAFPFGGARIYRVASWFLRVGRHKDTKVDEHKPMNSLLSDIFRCLIFVSYQFV